MLSYAQNLEDVIPARALAGTANGFQIAEIARLRAEVARLRHSTVTRTIHDLRVWARARVDANRDAR